MLNAADDDTYVAASGDAQLRFAAIADVKTYHNFLSNVGELS